MYNIFYISKKQRQLLCEHCLQCGYFKNMQIYIFFFWLFSFFFILYSLKHKNFWKHYLITVTMFWRAALKVSLSFLATLTFLLYSSTKLSSTDEIKGKLLQLLLTQSQGLLMSSGCPIEKVSEGDVVMRQVVLCLE